MQVVAHVAVFLDEGQRVLVDDKLFLETIAMSRLVVSIGDIADGDTLAAVLCPDPVGIGQVDADSRRGIFLATEHGGTDDIG